MAIQKINLGTEPLGEGGDTYRSANTKINQNFSDSKNAASRLVGTSNGQVPLAEQVSSLLGTAATKNVGTAKGDVLEVGTYGIGSKSAQIGNIDELRKSGFYDTNTNTTGSPNSGSSGVVLNVEGGRVGSTFQIWGLSNGAQNAESYIRHYRGSEWTGWAKVYTTANTTKEAGTGYLVASSPVLKMQHDSFEKVHESEQLDIEVKNIKTGVYEITGTTGLRENDGWNLKPPKDINGNVLCICEATEGNGVITLKTYKKKFDFETVSIVADYEQPTDIPEGAEVMLRFNDLPQDLSDEEYSV